MKNKHGPIDITMVTWHRPEITKLAIEAINRNTRKGNFRLIVVDNNSSPEMREDLYRMQEDGSVYRVIFNSENRGLESARNTGLNWVDSKYFICADNDCIPPPIEDGFDWIDRLVYLMDENNTYGAISCRTQVMIGTGNIFDGKEDRDIVEFPHPGGSLRIMRTKTVRDIGGWREDVKGRGAEERYVGGKLHEKKQKTGFATKIKCLHLFGKKDTDRWGYSKDWKPEKTGHSDIWHPVLEQGDQYEEVVEYVGEDLAKEYF